MNRLFITGVFLLATVVTTVGQERYVKFTDEGPNDKSFVAFRKAFMEALRERDAKYVLSVVDPKIKNSFGGDDGIAEFKEWWKLEDPKTEFWDEMLTVVSNGGFFTRGGHLFIAPYSFDGFPEDLDAFTYHVIFGNAVALRSAPSLESTVITRLSYNIVEIDLDRSIRTGKGKNAKHTWILVKTLGGKSGYVAAQYVRSPLGLRAGFEKKRGKWKLTFFLAGD